MKLTTLHLQQQDAHLVQTLRLVQSIPRTMRWRGRTREKEKDWITSGGLTFQLEGRRSLHIQKHTCSSCGYPAAKTRKCTFHPDSISLHDTMGGLRREEILTNILQTTGARRLRGGRPLDPDACVTSRPFPASSPTDSKPVYQRILEDQPRPNKGRKCIFGC